ncbi:hypothetical protein OG495_17365 [Streptomyces longwoodensis]|uniref:hypothetical protein n=1 Tax=Streptomyces longwoodensis TaxID=68231 RepID=UPI0038648B62
MTGPRADGRVGALPGAVCGAVAVRAVISIAVAVAVVAVAVVVAVVVVAVAVVPADSESGPPCRAGPSATCPPPTSTP